MQVKIFKPTKLYGIVTITLDEVSLSLYQMYNWSLDHRGDHNYIVRKGHRQGKLSKIYFHRQLLRLKKGYLVDHINHDGLDNRIENLRVCTSLGNNRNQRKLMKGTSKYKGVSWCRMMKAWSAEITVNYKKIRLGHYKTQEEAAIAYNTKALEYFGDFASINNTLKEL